MNFKPVFAAVVLVSGMSAASAAWISQDLGPFTLEYEDGTSFAGLSSTFSSSGDIYGFTWTVPNSVQVTSVGGVEAALNVPLPSFTITANPGWTLSNPSAFLGNLSYTEVGDGANTTIIGNANVSLNGGSAVAIGPHGVAWVTTNSGAGFSQGYFADTLSAPVAFHSLAVTDASIDLNANYGAFASISANPQNKLEISLMAVPVPEPETYAMMLAGLAALGWLSARRHRQG